MKQNTLYFLKITFYISILAVYTPAKSASSNWQEIAVYKGKTVPIAWKPRTPPGTSYGRATSLTVRFNFITEGMIIM